MNKKFWLSNVLLEQGFEYENGEIVGTKTVIENLLIEDGKIIDITNTDIPNDELPVLDVNKLLALPPFHEKHIHLDKTYYGGPWKAVTLKSGILDRIKEEEGYLVDFLPYTTERAEKVLELITGLGTTHARVQCNVDPVIGLGNLERVMVALQNYKNKLAYELVAFPQHGLLRSNSVTLVKNAMRNGANVVGGLDPAIIDNNIEESLQKMMDIAVEFNSDVDIHLHNNGSLGMYTIKRLTQMVEDAKWQGRVNISHAYCMGDSTSEEVGQLAEVLTALDISIATAAPINRSAPPIQLLQDKGVKVHIINDNLNDHFSPFGNGDLLEKANRAAEKFNWCDEYTLSRTFGFITNGLMPLDNKGNRQWPKIGDEANIVFIDCSCSAEAVARRSERKAVMFKGNVVSGII